MESKSEKFRSQEVASKELLNDNKTAFCSPLEKIFKDLAMFVGFCPSLNLK
jgi:hypothetical protein